MISQYLSVLTFPLPLRNINIFHYLPGQPPDPITIMGFTI